LLSPLLIVEETDLREGLRLYEEGTGFGSFDAVLAAAARAAGAEALLSADAGFTNIAAIRHVVPDAAGVWALLAAPED
jgi:predicted nucleic acid-binding protein